MRFAGIDPGKTGALVIVGDDGLTVLHAELWRDLDEPPILPIVTGDVVAVEDQFLGVNAHTMKVLVQWTERLVVSLPSGCSVVRPLAVTWRAAVFRKARLSRPEAKRLAIEACRLHAIDMPADLARSPDVAEAWAMARYAWGWARARTAA